MTEKRSDLKNVIVMANRDNHYEAAFEEFLRSRGVPYVAVDEAKRSLLERRRLDQEPRFHRLRARSDHVAGRCEGPPLSLGRRAEAILEELVDPRRSAKPGAVGGAVRGRVSAGCSFSPTTCWATARRCRPKSFFDVAAVFTASLPCRWPIMPPMPDRFRRVGTPGPCRPAISAVWPGRWRICWA